MFGKQFVSLNGNPPEPSCWQQGRRPADPRSTCDGNTSNFTKSAPFKVRPLRAFGSFSRGVGSIGRRQQTASPPETSAGQHSDASRQQGPICAAIAAQIGLCCRDALIGRAALHHEAATHGRDGRRPAHAGPNHAEKSPRSWSI